MTIPITEQASSIAFCMKGQTANRPTPTFIGQRYIDTDLGYEIIAQSLSPVIWTNAVGAPV
jgi:hypothetical protein